MINKLCTDLKTSKKLEELGIIRDTEFFWAETGKNKKQLEYVESEVGYFNSDWGYTRAYTLEQILELLPDKLPGGHDSEHLSLKKDMWWNVGYLLRGHNCYQISDYKNEGLIATAAKLLIKLKEDKII